MWRLARTFDGRQANMRGCLAAVYFAKVQKRDGDGKCDGIER